MLPVTFFWRSIFDVSVAGRNSNVGNHLLWIAGHRSVTGDLDNVVGTIDP